MAAEWLVFHSGKAQPVCHVMVEPAASGCSMPAGRYFSSRASILSNLQCPPPHSLKYANAMSMNRSLNSTASRPIRTSAVAA